MHISLTHDDIFQLSYFNECEILPRILITIIVAVSPSVSIPRMHGGLGYLLFSPPASDPSVEFLAAHHPLAYGSTVMESARRRVVDARNQDDFKGVRSAGGDTPLNLLLHASGHAVDLQNIYHGCSAFLIGGGPSFASVDKTKLSQPGCLTMAMNNAAKSIRPDLWVSVDDPSHFLRSIWLDAKIQKFAPLSHANRPIFDSDAWKFLDRASGDCPNTLFFKRNDHFNHETFLHEESVNWGNHRRHGGGRSVMLAAIRLLHYLGVRQVFLLGVDFEMKAEYSYHFAQDRHRSAIDCNRKTYEQLQKRFALLQPLFLEAGYHVFNCNPASKLEAFPYLPVEEAVAQCRQQMPEDLAAERTDGLYDRRKTGRSRPPAVRRSRVLSPPQLTAPKVLTKPRAVSNLPDSNACHPRMVVVGVDEDSEWLLPWWFTGFSRHNDAPLTFVDLGVSDAAREWCQERGRLVPLPRRFPRLSSARHYKPAFFILCHAKKILLLDLTCEIRGSIEPIFELIKADPVAGRDSPEVLENRRFFGSDKFFDTGVLGAPADHSVIQRWGKLTLSRHTDFQNDQETLNYALYQNRESNIVELPGEFNCPGSDEPDPSAIVVRWTGPSGLEQIRRQLSSK